MLVSLRGSGALRQGSGRALFATKLASAAARRSVGTTTTRFAAAATITTVRRHPQPFRLQQLQLQFPSSVRYASTVTVKVPQMAESISEGTLKQWVKSIGDFVEQDEEIATIETDKIDVAVNATEAGIIKEFLVNEEDTVVVGQEIVRLEPGGAPEGGASSSSSSESAAPEPEPKKEEEPAKAPAAESKPAPEPPKQQQPAPSKPSSQPPAPKPADADSPIGNRGERRVKMNRMRLRIAERLKQSQNTAASLTTFQEVDMTELMEFRKKYKDEVLKGTGVKLGFMGAFSRACVLAMREFPVVNAAIEESGDSIVYHDYVDISVAVATEKGLVTPVIRNVEGMDIVTIEKSIAEMGKKARDNKLTIEDMTGGTFTISNGGVFGSLMGTPIINMPQTAVLGLHAIKERPAVINGKIEVRHLMYLALTYDHRLLDGREAVLFLVRIKEFIEDPRKMLL